MRPHPQPIPPIDRIIINKPIKIEAALFFDGVAGEPATEGGGIVSVAVVEEVGFVVGVFGREPEEVDLCHIAHRAENFPKGPVLIPRHKNNTH